MFCCFKTFLWSIYILHILYLYRYDYRMLNNRWRLYKKKKLSLFLYHNSSYNIPTTHIIINGFFRVKNTNHDLKNFWHRPFWPFLAHMTNILMIILWRIFNISLTWPVVLSTTYFQLYIRITNIVIYLPFIWCILE